MKSLDELITKFFSNKHLDDVDSMDLACLIASNGKEGLSFLISNIFIFDEQKAKSAIFALTENYEKIPKLDVLLIELVKDDRELLVSEAIDGLAIVGEIGHWEIIKGFLNHRSPYVRGAVLRFARKKLVDKNYIFNILIKALNDPHFIVIENAIDELGELGLNKAVPFLAAFATHDHEDVRAAAKDSMEALQR